MAELDVTLAPGCYGIGLLFRAGSNECKTCPFAAQCSPLAQAQLVRLRAEFGIVAVKPSNQQADLSVSPAAVPARFSAKLPVKVQQLVDAIEADGIKVCDALSRGGNPFTNKFRFLRVACHMLLKRQGAGVQRAELVEAFERVLKIERGTADAYCLQAIKALRAIGAADEIDGLVKLV